MDPIAWELFVRAWGHNLLAYVDGAIYVAMSSKEMPLVSRVLSEEGGHWSDTIIWAKDRFVLGRADYQRAYEPIWYGWREGSTHHWCGDRDQGDVWEIPRPAEAPLHPTMKPLALMERAISNSSRAGDLVADFFAGSGSTLIGAERTGRRCAALELDPIYSDVIIARWESFSGEKAGRIDG
jgi:DNA modification methylase